jgi:hypothetical protein
MPVLQALLPLSVIPIPVFAKKFAQSVAIALVELSNVSVAVGVGVFTLPITRSKLVSFTFVVSLESLFSAWLTRFSFVYLLAVKNCT